MNNKPPLFRWSEGRQHGYEVFPIFRSTLLRCDLHLIHISRHGRVPPHIDEVVGFEHHRANFSLIEAKAGGVVRYLRPWGSDRLPRFHRFRPDNAVHWVTTVLDGQVLMISFGWLRRP